jgi:hypothetical protein
MEQAVLARRGAREAVADIEPRELHERIDSILADASMVPGTLVILSAQSVDPEVEAPAVEDRAAGVQLIYEGLRLTRTLARTEPWADGDGDADADLAVLAADVLVSRGFYLLAMTDAAERAVETVRSFGRDQTHGREPDADREALDRNLEADVFELAAVAGTSVVDSPPDDAVGVAINELVRSTDGEPLPAAATLFGAGADTDTSLAPDPVDDPARPSPTDP